MATVTVIPIRESARTSYREPTLAEMLSDPVVAAVMQADGVDPDEFVAMLDRTARSLRAAARSDSWPRSTNGRAHSSAV